MSVDPQSIAGSGFGQPPGRRAWRIDGLIVLAAIVFLLTATGLVCSLVHGGPMPEHGTIGLAAIALIAASLCLLTWRRAAAVTALARTERAAALAARRQLEAALHSIADPLLIGGPDGRIVFANRAYAALIPDGDRLLAESRSCVEILAAEASLVSALAPVAGEAGGDSAETAIATLLDGRKMLFRDHAIPGGGVIAMRTDITARLALETERAAYRDQFHHAMKMEAVGRLAGGIAHDFNNVLGAILSLGQMLAADLDAAAQQQRMAQRIVAAAQRGGELVRQIMAFSRKAPEPAEIADLASAVEQTVSLLQAATPAKIQIACRAMPSLPVACGASRLGQIAMNLCVNARDAIDGSGRIDIALRWIDRSDTPLDWVGMAPAGMHRLRRGQSSPESRYAELSVSDNGAGMTPSVLARIFDPFFTTKAEGLGSGLGLAAVDGIVRDLGGWIAVETAPGRGATFRIYLPLADTPLQTVSQRPDSPDL